MRSLVQRVAGRLGVQLVRQDTLARLHQSEASEKSLRRTVDFLLAIPTEQFSGMRECLAKSRSQLLQDLFVLSQTNFKRDGYFVEFGATNGIDLSNTYLLETEFGWRGILAEPAQRWHTALKSNRRATLEFDCVWTVSGDSIEFNEAAEGEFSTIEQFSASDHHQHYRASGSRYRVSTVSLGDMLSRHDAPARIDYLSIDTEGSEYEILKSFDFTRYTIDIVTVEHNFTANRGLIHDLLASHGYRRVYEQLSDCDDWYVRPDMVRTG